MKKSFIFGLLIVALLATAVSTKAVSAELTNNWIVEINGKDVNASRPIIFIGPENTLLLNFTAVNTSSNVQIIAEWRPVGGNPLFGFETSPFNIVSGNNYSEFVNFDAWWSQVPEGKYILNLTITNDQIHDSMEIKTFVQRPRIPLYSCGVLNKTWGDYILQNDIISQGDCIVINAHFVKLDLNGHKITGNGTGQGISSDWFYNVDVKNGEINNFAEGIYISDGQNSQISNVSMNHNKHYGISIYKGSNHVIKNNIIREGSSEYSSFSAIYLYQSSQNLVSENTLDKNYWGVYVRDGENNNIVNNSIISLESASAGGVKLGGGDAQENIVANNRITGEGGFGIFIEDGSMQNEISDNYIEGQKNGMWIEYGEGNIISGNEIIDNHAVGIVIEESIDNKIYNNLFNNNLNARFEDDIYFNSWNNPQNLGPNIIGGPFIGGNVWLQPNGGGFSQTCLDINQDRICDESYNLEENNADYLPLAWFELGAPTINFIAPTPAHGSSQSQNSIYVNVSSSAENDHYVFVDFDKTNKLWMRMDDIDADGNPLDLSSYGNNGTLYGDAHQINDGKYGSSFAFDGSSDSIQIDYPVTTKTDNVSLAFWAKWAGDTNANEIMVYNGNTATSGFGFRLDKSEGNQYELLIGGVGWVETSDYLTPNVWTHLAAVRNNGKWIIYKNGFPVNITSGSTLTPNLPTDKFLIGINSVGTASFNGTIDEAFVFDRMLSQREVRSLYDAGVYQYFRNFTNLGEGTHEFKGYAVSTSGQQDKTEKRIVTISSTGVIPLYQCQTLDQENGHYLLIKDILTDGDCFDIVADHITLDMNNYALEGADQNGWGISVQADDVTIKNGKISNFEQGIVATNTHNLSIINNVVTNSQESGIELDDAFSSYIYSNYLYLNEEGIIINDGNSNVIKNNIIANSTYKGLLLETTSLNIIKDTSIINSKRGDLEVGALSPEHCNNELSNITWTEGHPTEFYNHQVNLENVESHGIILCNADNSTLNNVTLVNDKTMNGLILLLTDNSVLSNVLIENTYDGLKIYNSNYNIFNNLTSQWNRYLGITFTESNYNKIIQSYVHHQILGIEISGNNNIIENSHIFSNYAGIFVGEAVNTTIRGNYIYDAELEEGIYLGEETFSTRIYNNFLNNTLNVGFDEEIFGFWNINLTSGPNIIGGQYIGGNYWANPSGTGFSEACKDGNNDGICDQQYIVAENNIDYYPLTY